jgi:hypothetical protein
MGDLGVSAPEQDDFTFDATRGWSMSLVVPQLSGGAPVPDSNLRSVAAESTAHGVPDGGPRQAGASPDARMMRAAIEPDPWLLLAGEVGPA